jgi:hypothetical protein
MTASSSPSVTWNCVDPAKYRWFGNPNFRRAVALSVNRDKMIRLAYLDQGRVLAALRATGADAVWPGWGFLAEDADSLAPRQVEDVVHGILKHLRRERPHEPVRPRVLLGQMHIEHGRCQADLLAPSRGGPCEHQKFHPHAAPYSSHGFSSEEGASRKATKSSIWLAFRSLVFP